jgi:hypothetical protein
MNYHKIYLHNIFEIYSILRQAQYRYFDKLSTGASTSSAQAELAALVFQNSGASLKISDLKFYTNIVFSDL